MKNLTNLRVIREYLEGKEFTMYNKLNPKGEVTTLTGVDVDNIIGDMDVGVTLTLAVDGLLTVRYPHNVCTLLSVWRYTV